MQQINNTTFFSLDLGDAKPVVTIGGKSADKFYPNVNNSFHDDEFFFNLNCIDDIVTDESATKLDGVISQTINNEKHEYYIDDSGRLKWDKVFSSCPDSMRARFKVRKSAGVQFYYQGALTEEEIADGCIRPDDIVGSYAVYCDKANNKYKTGKLCHIPRPFVIDVLGNCEWCVMIYEEISDMEGMLYIDMPEDFMRTASYPVRLDPTMGYTTAGGSASGSRLVVLQTSTMSSSGTLGAMYGYARMVSSTSGLIKVGVYNDNSGVPGTLFDGPDEISVPSTTVAWYSSSGAGTLNSGNKYYPALTNNFDAYIYYDTSTANSNWYVLGGYGMPNNPSVTAQDRKYSLYFEYTESGGTGGPLVGASALVGGGVLCGQGNLIN